MCINKHLRLFIAFSLAGIFCYVSNLSAQCPPANKNITIENLASTPSDGCSNGTITITLSANAADYTVVSYELSGPVTITPSNFTAGSTQ